jgi:hypothetical protein
VSFVAECECRGEFVVASKVVHSRHRIAAGMSKLPQALMTFTPSTWRGSRGALAGFGGNPHRAAWSHTTSYCSFRSVRDEKGLLRQFVLLLDWLEAFGVLYLASSAP